MWDGGQNTVHPQSPVGKVEGLAFEQGIWEGVVGALGMGLWEDLPRPLAAPLPPLL